MKKISAIILLLALTLALTACGEKSNSKDDDSSTKKEPQSSSECAESKESGSTATGDVGDIVVPTPIIPSGDVVSSDEPTSSQNGGDTTAVTPSNTQSKPSGTTSKPSTTTSKPSGTTTSKPSGTTASKPTPTPSTPSANTSKQPVVANEFKNYSNAIFTTNDVTIRPQHVYWQNGALHADCYVLNGRSTRITNINVKSLSFANSKGLIASANFNVLNNGRVVEIDADKYIVWTFTFPTNCVASPNANLSTLNCNFDISYSYYNS